MALGDESYGGTSASAATAWQTLYAILWGQIFLKINWSMRNIGY
jgi:hypothetical protein